jgi:prevent-host-death family protein
VRIAPVADIKARFSAYLKASEEGPIIVTRNGRPVAVLLSIDDDEEIERLLLAYSPKVQEILEAAKKQIRQGQGSRPRKLQIRPDEPEYADRRDQRHRGED